MTTPLLIGIDLGTTNGKVACYDLKGCLHAKASHSYPTYYPHPGWAEQNPLDWLLALEKGLREVAGKLGSRIDDVIGMAVSTFGPGMVIIGEDGEPLAPCPTWQDRRCYPQGKRLLEAVGNNWIGHGAPLSAFPAKLLWAIDEIPEITARAKCITPIKGFLLYWLTGKITTDPSSGPGAIRWWAPAIEFAGWDIKRLPQILAPTESPGGLREAIAKQVGLKAGVPVFTSLNDGAAATLGSGAVHLGDSVATIATNGAARVLLSKRVKPEIALERCLFTWPFLDELWVCGGLTFNGANSLRWLADQFSIPRDDVSYDALFADAARVPAGSRGVLFLPYLGGRGTPDPKPDLRASFLHLSIKHKRAELTRAVLEGIAFSLREIYDEFERLKFDVDTVRLTGGGARSPLWRQIIVNVLNRPASLAEGDSTLGNAMVAAVGLGYYQDFSTAAEEMVTQQTFQGPDPEAVVIYERLYKRFYEIRDVMLNSPGIGSAG